MGVVEFNNANYFTISEGRICKQHKTPVEGSVTRENKEGRTVHETFHQGLRGKIVNVEKKDTKYGLMWYVTLEDATGERDVLQFNYSGGYAASFLKTLPNVDLSAEVIIAPKMEIVNEKKRGTIFIMQHGKALGRYYNQDHPNGLPDMIQVKDKKTKKLVWDDSDQMEFLEDMVNNEILPQLKQLKNNVAPVKTTEVEEVDVEDDPDKDLPF